MKKSIVRLFLFSMVFLLLISFASAVWWNPNTWFGNKNSVKLSPPAENSIFVNVSYLGQLDDETAPYSFNHGSGNDFTFSLKFSSASGLTIQRMELVHTGYRTGEYWRTYGNIEKVYPLVILDSTGNKVNNFMVEPALTVVSGAQSYRLYIQPGYNTFEGGALTITLSNGDAVTLNIPKTVGQTVTYGTFGQGVGGNTCISFTYSDWTPATCSYGSQQTRTVTGSPSGCTGGNPESSTRTCPTCIDTDGGLNYSVFGSATAYNGFSATDSCGSGGDIGRLFEAYCKPSDGTVSTQAYDCPNGCASGRCLDAPVVASCTDLNVTTRALINSKFVYNSSTGKWADRDGDLLHLNSNDWVNKSEYILLVADNGRQAIYEVTEIINSSSSTPSDDEITLVDISDRSLATTAKGSIEGSGKINFLGQSFQYNYRGTQIIPERSRQVRFNSLKNYSSCSIYTAPTCIDSDEKDYYTKGLTKGVQVGVGGNTYMDSYDFCLVAGGSNRYVVENYCLTTDNFVHEQTYECPNGCYDGACVYGSEEEIILTNVNNLASFNLGNDLMQIKLVSATDSSASIEIIDGSEVIGAEITEGTSKIIAGVNVFVAEANEGLIGGIRLVVVLSLEQVCEEYISDVKNPSDFIKSGLAFELNGNGSYTGSEWVKSGNGYQEYFYHANYADWRNTHDGKYYYFGKNVKVFDDVSFNAKKIFDEIIESELCVEREFDGQKAFVCAYNGLTGSNVYNSILWFNNNVLVVVDVAIWAKSITSEDITAINNKNLNSLVRDIQDNKYKDIIQNFDLESVFDFIVNDDLRTCSSDVISSVSGGSSGSAYCKIEPVVCPEYGRQTEKCVRYVNGREVVNEKQLQCSPGVCSGCMVPRWMGYDFAGSKTNSICIPYGTRLANSEDSDSEKVNEGYYPEGDKEYLNLTIIDTNSAYLDLDINGALFKGNIYEGNTVDAQNIRFRVEEIFTAEESDNDEGYIEISIIESFDAYCKYDGDLYEQKGDDAECQNNYECSSNECRTGQCVNTYVGVSENNNLLIKIICRIVNFPPFGDKESYEQCLLEYIGGNSSGSSSSSSDGRSGQSSA